MTITTKAALAAELSVSKSRVSQYVTAGLPVRADGKIDREIALDWIGRNLRSGPNQKKGPARARTIAPLRPAAKPHGDFESAQRALVFMLCRDQHYIATTAVDLGLPMAMAYALADQIHMGLLDVAKEHLQVFGVPGRVAGFTLDHPDFDTMAPNWAALAERVGEPHDEDAWSSNLDRLMGWEQ